MERNLFAFKVFGLDLLFVFDPIIRACNTLIIKYLVTYISDHSKQYFASF